MKINRWLILACSVMLQIASWFDITSFVNQFIEARPMNALQTAQLVGSGILFIVFWSIRNSKNEAT